MMLEPPGEEDELDLLHHRDRNGLFKVAICFSKSFTLHLSLSLSHTSLSLHLLYFLDILLFW